VRAAGATVLALAALAAAGGAPPAALAAAGLPSSEPLAPSIGVPFVEGSGTVTGGPPPRPPTAPAPPSPRMLIGTNDGWGWGEHVALTILHAHIAWDRVELRWSPSSARSSTNDGFHVLAVVNAIPDETPLSAIEANAWGAEVVQELRANPGVSIAEAGNESYLKGGVANPAQYARMYMAAIRDMKAAGITTPLLFNMTGDFPRGSWSAPTSWSLDSAGGGWLREAVKAVPGLAAAILANGISIHAYGEVGEDVRDDTGIASAAADEAVAASVLGAVPPFYVTEFGYDLGRCGAPAGACSKPEQATKLKAAYKAFAADPHVAGIWWYESHDDSTGQWGYMNANNTKRAAFNALSRLALANGQ
jgi:hypothetical protein